MNWPLELATTHARLVVPGPGRYVLALPAGEETIDQLLAAAHALLGGTGAGWVPEDGGLLSNLPAWENILLSTQWHAPAAPAALEARLRGWMARFGYDEEGARLLLSRQPARLDEDEQRLVGWLRLLLARPKLVLLEGRAMPEGLVGLRLLELLAEELPACALLFIDDDAPPGCAPLSFTETGTPTP